MLVANLHLLLAQDAFMRPFIGQCCGPYSPSDKASKSIPYRENGRAARTAPPAGEFLPLAIKAGRYVGTLRDIDVLLCATLTMQLREPD